MVVCCDCQTELTDDNWYPSTRKVNRHFCKSCLNRRSRIYRNKNHKNYYSTANKKNARKLKIEVLSHYSDTNPPQCANLFGEHDKPYTTIEALTIDHINDNGAEERKENGRRGGASFYALLKQRKYPLGYQVLCWNCQWIKRIRKTFIKVGKEA
jgi:hypothetical protein